MTKPSTQGMCKKCKEESDDDYEGDSIEEKRRKAVASIAERHPELMLDPEDITFRFTPKHKTMCVRVNLNTDSPKYEIHERTAMGPAMKGGPPLSAIAQAAFIASDKSYQEICEILDITPGAPYKALFMSTEPPVNPIRLEYPLDGYEFDSELTEYYDEKK